MRSIDRRLAFILILMVAVSGRATAQSPLLSAMFQDHAVLQRDQPIPVRGHASPGMAITVSLADHSAKTIAGPNGNWQISMPALPAGGPYSLEVSSATGARQVVTDLLIGDVWLCSGQSNMQLQVHRSLDSRSEIQTANNDRIRMMTVPLTDALRPLEDFAQPAPWQKTTPETVGEFSAACYYFARELQKSVTVPIGLVNASLGGANIRSFIGEKFLRSVGGYEQGLDILQAYEADPAAGTARWGARWEDWWRHAMPGSEPWRPDADSADWQPAEAGPWDGWADPAIAHFVGQMWFRTDVALSAQQAAEAESLSLGPVNEEDVTWVNGKAIGTSFGYGVERRYRLPAGTLHAGSNSIVTTILCTYRGCGMLGAAQDRTLRLQDGTMVALSNPWRYKKVPPQAGPPPRVPWGTVPGMTMAYNAMIAPIGAFAFRGAIWYQGESNTAEANGYAPLLRALIADWRERFGPDLPFLIVQLPNYGQPPTAPTESAWARLREAQRQVAAADSHAGLAVTIDIGERQDLHPANKQEVGRRLARLARHIIYGEALPPAGPTALSAHRDRNTVTISFGGIEKGLVAYDATSPIGFELCGATQASCRYANARIAGEKVTLTIHSGLTPTHIRYCWADSPICTLFDGNGLPAGPFDLPIL